MRAPTRKSAKNRRPSAAKRRPVAVKRQTTAAKRPPVAAKRPPRAASRTRVTSIMTRDVAVVRPDLSLDSLAELLLARDLSRLPVVDDQERPIGMVGKTDLVREQHDRGETEEAPGPPLLHGRRGLTFIEPGMHVERNDGTTVGDVMSRKVLSLSDSSTIEEAARLMASHHVHGVPVISPEGKLVGFLSSMDILAWLAGPR